jgi:DNA-3-methyladenine glycosylase II
LTFSIQLAIRYPASFVTMTGTMRRSSRLSSNGAAEGLKKTGTTTTTKSAGSKKVQGPQKINDPAAGKGHKSMPPPAKAEKPAGKRKAATSDASPVTPQKKARGLKTKKTLASVEPPPLTPTPTPSVIGVIAHTATSPIKTPQKPRRVAPHATNAPLQTPGGTRVIKTYPSDLAEPLSSQTGPSNTLTTENFLQTACDHLVSVDPKLQQVIDKFHCKAFSPEGLQEQVDPFVSLVSSIISQQVCDSGHALIGNTKLRAAQGLWSSGGID